MGYLHIQNLYKSQTILLFHNCYALEKVHGTSAHISFNSQSTEVLRFFSGGESHTRFVNLFDQAALTEAFLACGWPVVTVYGEAYGGRQQGMAATYGDRLGFIVFDITVGDRWLNVPEMAAMAASLGLESVPYEEIKTTLEEMNRVRDLPSEVAVRRGMGGDKRREGVVLRPLVEMTDGNGDRVITKHKLEAFSERATPQKIVSSDKLVVLAEAEAIATEWVTPMRLQHVLQKLPDATDDMRTIPSLIKAMVEDVYREGTGEIVESKEASQAIGKRAAMLFKEHVARLTI